MDLESQSARICAVANLASHNSDFPKMSFLLYVTWEKITILVIQILNTYGNPPAPSCCFMSQ